MVIATAQHNFGSISGSGPQTATAAVSMGASVTKATAILTGFNIEYSGQNDHHLGLLDIEVSVPPGGISGSTVNVNISYGLRDWSGNWDDPYDGTIFFSVVGE